MTLVWALAAALGYWLVARYRTGAVIIGLAVLSHWLLDLISHRPDMPLYPGASPLLGLGLWYSVACTVIVELSMLGAGLWIYTATTRARDRIGTYGLWSFVALMAVVYAAGLVFGPPPPNDKATAWSGISFLASLLPGRIGSTATGRPRGRRQTSHLPGRACACPG